MLKLKTTTKILSFLIKNIKILIKKKKKLKSLSY